MDLRPEEISSIIKDQIRTYDSRLKQAEVGTVILVGDGIAIKPSGNKMVAPCDGTIGKIFETNHAFSIESDSGLELFVHFGIDTVELKGEGFTRIAQEGQQVKKGDTVIEFDLALLEAKAKSTLTPVVISNMDEIKELSKQSGAVTLAEDVVLRVRK